MTLNSSADWRSRCAAASRFGLLAAHDRLTFAAKAFRLSDSIVAALS